jgi:hypothetical protein
MTEQIDIDPTTRPVQAPDPILAELWEVKRQINAEAGYDIATLVRMAHEATLAIRPAMSDKK